MVQLLKLLGVPGLFISFIALVLITILLLKWMIRYEEKKALANPQPLNPLLKKNPNLDVNHFGGLIFKIGLSISLLFTYAMFEFPNFEKDKLVELTADRVEFEEMMEIPPTEQLPPPPPKIKSPEIVAVPDEKEIEYEIEIDLDMEADEETIVEEVEDIIVEEEPEQEVAEQIFEIVEDPAKPVGGLKAFYTFVGENIKYPRKALELSVSGKVYVQFVVDKDGSLTNFKVVRGIGVGCDEEAIRVLSIAPKWTPGKQRGRAVKQRMIIPITFKMANM